MSTTRLRRLRSDYEAVRRLARLHPHIDVEGVSGNPPERYRLVIRVRSLREKAGRIVIGRTHRLEVILPRGYPRDAPLCRMLTPVFHPNIAPHAVCIGDHWSAAETLDLMIQRVGEMLGFQSYNIKSPLNGAAARWVEENLHRLPIHKEEFFVDSTTEVTPETAPETREGECANCGAECAGTYSCSRGHVLCADCQITCETCKASLCVLCGEHPCPTCVIERRCANCGADDAESHGCSQGHCLCAECLITCETCRSPLCILCGEHPCKTCAISDEPAS